MGRFDNFGYTGFYMHVFSMPSEEAALGVMPVGYVDAVRYVLENGDFTSKQVEAILNRYGLEGRVHCTFSELGRILKCSASAARQQWQSGVLHARRTKNASILRNGLKAVQEIPRAIGEDGKLTDEFGMYVQKTKIDYLNLCTRTHNAIQRGYNGKYQYPSIVWLILRDHYWLKRIYGIGKGALDEIDAAGLKFVQDNGFADMKHFRELFEEWYGRHIPC